MPAWPRKRLSWSAATETTASVPNNDEPPCANMADPATPTQVSRYIPTHNDNHISHSSKLIEQEEGENEEGEGSVRAGDEHTEETESVVVSARTASCISQHSAARTGRTRHSDSDDNDEDTAGGDSACALGAFHPPHDDFDLPNLTTTNAATARYDAHDHTRAFASSPRNGALPRMVVLPLPPALYDTVSANERVKAAPACPSEGAPREQTASVDMAQTSFGQDGPTHPCPDRPSHHPVHLSAGASVGSDARREPCISTNALGRQDGEQGDVPQHAREDSRPGALSCPVFRPLEMSMVRLPHPRHHGAALFACPSWTLPSRHPASSVLLELQSQSPPVTTTTTTTMTHSTSSVPETGSSSLLGKVGMRTWFVQDMVLPHSEALLILTPFDVTFLVLHTLCTLYPAQNEAQASPSRIQHTHAQPPPPPQQQHGDAERADAAMHESNSGRGLFLPAEELLGGVPFQRDNNHSSDTKSFGSPKDLVTWDADSKHEGHGEECSDEDDANGEGLLRRYRAEAAAMRQPPRRQQAQHVPPRRLGRAEDDDDDEANAHSANGAASCVPELRWWRGWAAALRACPALQPCWHVMCSHTVLARVCEYRHAPHTIPRADSRSAHAEARVDNHAEYYYRFSVEKTVLWLTQRVARVQSSAALRSVLQLPPPLTDAGSADSSATRQDTDDLTNHNDNNNSNNNSRRRMEHCVCSGTTNDGANEPIVCTDGADMASLLEVAYGVVMDYVPLSLHAAVARKCGLNSEGGVSAMHANKRATRDESEEGASVPSAMSSHRRVGGGGHDVGTSSAAKTARTMRSASVKQLEKAGRPKGTPTLFSLFAKTESKTKGGAKSK